MSKRAVEKTVQHLTDIIHCARCGENHVGDHKLAFMRFDRPIIDGDGLNWTHWAICPNTGDPVLQRTLAVPEVVDKQ